LREKIDVQYLKPGMYVAELDRPWRETPFLFQGFEIRSQAEIEALRQHCKWVYINTPAGGWASPTPRPAAPARHRPQWIETEAEQRVAHDFLKIVNQPRPQPVYRDACTLEDEIPAAREHYAAAGAVIQQMFDDIRAGKSIDSTSLKRVVGELARSVIRNPDALTCFAQLKKKDEYTAMHSVRVCILALMFGRHLGLEPGNLELLGTGALLHDIGKVKVPAEILQKPEPLTGEEFSLMKMHVPWGVQILEQARSIPRAAIEVTRQHHERYEGGGYIAGLRHEQISLFGMIGGIVDCYDAVTSDRAYRAGVSAHAALRQMYGWRGRDFHPRLVEQFIQCLGIYPIGSVVELSTGEIGVVVTTNRVRRLKPRVTLILDNDNRPYDTPPTIDLLNYRAGGAPCEIDRVVEPGVYGIDPVLHLPVANTARFTQTPAPTPI